jgi:HSP90 family molecular chaperone
VHLCRRAALSRAGRRSYTIAEDDSEPIAGSGTRLILHLKEDSDEYLDDFKVNFNLTWCPIQLPPSDCVS